MKYDYLIVGAGLFGSVFAYEMHKAGKKVLVIDKRPHIGGNAYTENIEGINVHKYGPHIFHTNDKAIWGYINQFAEFNNFINSPIAKYHNKLYSLPFNMYTFNQIWGVITPEQAKNNINVQKEKAGIETPKNLEEQAISLVGKDIYEKLIKGYTEKQWGRNCKDLPASIIKRLPVRFTYNNNYFDAKYQGIPIGGYTKLISNMLEGIDIKLNSNYFDERSYYNDIADKIVYTGPIDEFYNYKFGPLQYRSVRFEEELYDMPNYQGNAVINYTDKEVPYTRIIEHKWFEPENNTSKTIITKEYSQEWNKDIEPFYPINNGYNENLYHGYERLSKFEENIIFGGRLADYKYYDMDKTIEKALEAVNNELKRCDMFTSSSLS